MGHDVIKFYGLKPTEVNGLGIASATTAFTVTDVGSPPVGSVQLGHVNLTGNMTGFVSLTGTGVAYVVPQASTVPNPTVLGATSAPTMEQPSTQEFEHSTSAPARLLSFARFLFPAAGSCADIEDAVAAFQREHRAALAAGDRSKALRLSIQYSGTIVYKLAVVLRLDKVIDLVWKVLNWFT